MWQSQLSGELAVEAGLRVMVVGPLEGQGQCIVKAWATDPERAASDGDCSKDMGDYDGIGN
jgi:hypothetical protein